ncbi:MAG: glutamate--cysteine ligase, partial [Bdellovibrionota bacterium]
SGDELKQTNSRIRNKMSIGKNRLPIDSVIVQEGIPTATMVNRLAAEPVIYLCGCELVGGFLRTHAKKGIDENLNSPGMVFRKLCMSDLFSPDNYDSTQEIPPDTDQNTEPVLELVYGSIARVSALATGMELTR